MAMLGRTRLLALLTVTPFALGGCLVGGSDSGIQFEDPPEPDPEPIEFATLSVANATDDVFQADLYLNGTFAAPGVMQTMAMPLGQVNSAENQRVQMVPSGVSPRQDPQEVFLDVEIDADDINEGDHITIVGFGNADPHADEIVMHDTGVEEDEIGLQVGHFDSGAPADDVELWLTGISAEELLEFDLEPFSSADGTGTMVGTLERGEVFDDAIAVGALESDDEWARVTLEHPSVGVFYDRLVPVGEGGAGVAGTTLQAFAMSAPLDFTLGYDFTHTWVTIIDGGFGFGAPVQPAQTRFLHGGEDLGDDATLEGRLVLGEDEDDISDWQEAHPNVDYADASGYGFIYGDFDYELRILDEDETVITDEDELIAASPEGGNAYSITALGNIGEDTFVETLFGDRQTPAALAGAMGNSFDFRAIHGIAEGDAVSVTLVDEDDEEWVVTEELGEFDSSEWLLMTYLSEILDDEAANPEAGEYVVLVDGEEVASGVNLDAFGVYTLLILPDDDSVIIQDR